MIIKKRVEREVAPVVTSEDPAPQVEVEENVEIKLYIIEDEDEEE